LFRIPVPSEIDGLFPPWKSDPPVILNPNRIASDP
jgi:hypothetical protein